MLDTAHMKQVMQDYIDRFNARDVSGILALYAPDAVVEDPVGSSSVPSGHAAIREFYEKAMQIGATLKLAGRVRGSHGNAAAMAFEVTIPQGRTIHVIDVMTFDANGLVATMKAYWGPDDFV
ncbi:MAG: nuclear transport factor 2 family protein [Rhodocyclales bacterium]|nr:nuclear transport factor 2 family protein [Rhodocyclales bacterium]